MIPAIGDTLDGRYTLIAQYRTQPGLSAWIAHDYALDEDCQIFLLTDQTRIGIVSQIASALVLSKNPRSTLLRRFHTVGDALLVVMEPDPGVALSTLISDKDHPLSFALMRMVVNELIDAIESLHSSQIDFHTLTPEVVRLTNHSLLLSAVPLDPYITPPLVTNARQTSTSPEMLAILQISAILFKMLTGVTFDPQDMESMSTALLAARQSAELRSSDIPTDFLTILERALGVHWESDGSEHRLFPIYTLMEMQALLDDPRRPDQLAGKDLSLPKTRGTASVSLVSLLPSDQRDIVYIPDSLVSTDTVHNEAGVVQPWSRQELLAATHVQEVDPTGILGPTDTGASRPIRAGRSSDSRRSGMSEQPPAPSTPIASEAPTVDAAEREQKTESAYLSEAENEMQAEKSAHTQTIVDHHMLSPADSRRFAAREEAEEAKKANPHRLGQGIVIFLAVLAILIGGVLAVRELQNTVHLEMPWSRQEKDSDIGKHWNIDVSKAPLPGNAENEAQEQQEDSGKRAKRTPTARTSSSARKGRRTRQPRTVTRHTSKGVIIEDKNASAVPKPVQPVTNPVPLSFTQRFFSTEAGRGIAISLNGTHRVSTVTITLRGTVSAGSGKVYVDATVADPQHGKPAANFTFNSGGQPTKITLNGNPSTSSLVIWVDQQPEGGMYYSNLSVLGQ